MSTVGVAAARPGSRRRLRIPVSPMPDGAPATLFANVHHGRRPGPVLLVVAGHHGDEHEGPTALLRVWEELARRDVNGTVVLVPVLNAPAFRFANRRSLDDGLDLNRVFPGRADGSLTERIAHTLVDSFLGAADFVLSMHGLSAGYQVEPYVEYPSTGSTAAAAGRAAAAFGTGFVNPFDPGEGRLMTHATQLGIPLVEVEIGGCGCTQPAGRRLYEEGTLRLMEHLGMLETRSVHTVAQPCRVFRVESNAPCGGILRPSVALGEAVTAGVELATIHDLNLRRVAAVVAPRAGVVGIQRVAANVLPGQLVATVFQAVEGER